RLYQILSGLIPSQRGLSSRLLGRSDVPNLSGSARQFPIGAVEPKSNCIRARRIHPDWESHWLVCVPLEAAEVLSQNR
ncbi:hypothetical protein ACKI1K_41265, partial [Streptomyces scabiei]|uniref:hypothetical protein n=1 Tax=Streptomyces scabiei TaxID=1930 RepID=UPI0038F79326